MSISNFYGVVSQHVGFGSVQHVGVVVLAEVARKLGEQIERFPGPAKLLAPWLSRPSARVAQYSIPISVLLVIFISPYVREA